MVPGRIPEWLQRLALSKLTVVGLLDVILGRRKLAGPAPDRLFAISTAYVTFETGLQITSRGSAGIVFQPLQTADFLSIVRDMEEVVKATSRTAALRSRARTTPTAFAG